MQFYRTLFLFLFTCFSSQLSFADNKTFPEIISLPTGFQPEGVVTGKRHSAYVGSLKSGAIYETNLVTGKGKLLVEGSENKSAVGLAYDKRSEYLYVAGGITGKIAVYDTDDGELVAEFDALDTGVTGMVNDGIVTRKGAYFTDSLNPVIYKIALNYHGRFKNDAVVETINLGGDYLFVEGEFNSNGIVATKNGKSLIVINMETGTLYQVDPKNGNCSEIPVSGGELPNGDGMLLDDNKLYIVQNLINQLAVVELSYEDSVTSGVVEKYIYHPDFQIPTTVAGFGDWLYVVNAKFDVAPPPLPGFPPADPSIEYALIRVEK